MTPHNLAVSLGISILAASPAFAEAVATPSESNINWAIVLPITFFVVGQAINVATKLLLRYLDGKSRRQE